MVKILIMTIQVKFVKRHKNSPELSLLKFLPLTYHHSHFLAATLDFTSFFTIAFLRAAHFFLQLGCFGLDIYIYICICICMYIIILNHSTHMRCVKYYIILFVGTFIKCVEKILFCNSGHTLI